MPKLPDPIKVETHTLPEGTQPNPEQADWGGSGQALPSLPNRSEALNRSEEIKNLIVKSGGIFLGQEELANLGVISVDAELPRIPAKYSAAFLEAVHPLRGGLIANHVILAFDTGSYRWRCVEKNMIPKSGGLTWEVQEELLRRDGEQIKVEGLTIASPHDSFVEERILKNVVAHFQREGKILDDQIPPGQYARTADTRRAEPDCRVIMGRPEVVELDEEIETIDDCENTEMSPLLGLMACWE